MRILLVKTSSLGDVIHNLPVASDIRRVYPEAQIDWVVEEGFAEIPRLHPAVRRVVPVAVRRWRKSLFSPTIWREMREYRRLASADFYDAVLDTQGLIKSALLSAQASGEKLGHAATSAREPLAARFYDRSFVIAKTLHAVTRNRQLAAAALGYVLDDLPLDYGITAPPLSAAWLPTGDYAVLLTATSRADKEWPEENWRALGSALIATGVRCVLPGGSAAERSRAGRLAQSLGRAVAAPANEPHRSRRTDGWCADRSGRRYRAGTSGCRTRPADAGAVLRFRSGTNRCSRHCTPCQSWWPGLAAQRC